MCRALKCNNLSLVSFLLLSLFTSLVNVLHSQKDISVYDSVFEQYPQYESEGFVFPIGDNLYGGYYNAKKFDIDNHLGDDWNGVGGGDSDLGDPIYASASGYVFYARDTGIDSWGNVIRIVHKHNGKYYETLYAHCDEINIAENSMVPTGGRIGTIGNANGHYLAHLHFELRDDVTMGLGHGYHENKKGYLDPTAFIEANAYQKEN